MGNTLGTTNGAIIAQQALKTLLADFPVISQITTNFQELDGGVVGKYNQSLITHVVTAGTASDWTGSAGYAAADRTETDVSITLNKFKYHAYSVTDAERSSTNINLINRFADTAAHALGKAIVDDLIAVVTSSNFSTVLTEGSAGSGGAFISPDGFDRSAMVDIATKLSKNKVERNNRFAVLNADYYGALLKDSSIISVLNFPGTQAGPKGVLPNIAGMDVSEYVDLATQSQNLVGFAGSRQGLVLATRVPEMPEAPVPGLITNVTDDRTGLTIQVREHYNMDYGWEKRVYTLLYGVGVGVPGNICRIAYA